MRQLSHLSLESRKSTYLRLSITDRCDLCCTYCRPGEQPVTPDDSLSASEIAILVDAFAQNGITKVRLTGGEPLVRDDVVETVRSIARTPGIETVALTTNGTRLPQLASELRGAGLQAVNISLDTLNPETFRRIAGQDRLQEVLSGIEAAVQCGFDKVKINTVVMRGINDGELPAIANLARTMPVDVRFIELMPLAGQAHAVGARLVPPATGYQAAQGAPLQRCETEWQAMYVGAEEIREILGDLTPMPGERGSSARLYSIPGGRGAIGIISPMSEPFCDRCSRVRVTSSGALKPCLRLPIEADLRPILHERDLIARLGELLSRLGCHKLSEASSMISAIQADAMCSVGG